MSVSDAVREIEVTREGVVVFRDVESDTLSILVRDHETGELTLVQTDPLG
jgi:hypothetical protein